MPSRISPRPRPRRKKPGPKNGSTKLWYHEDGRLGNENIPETPTITKNLEYDHTTVHLQPDEEVINTSKLKQNIMMEKVHRIKYPSSPHLALKNKFIQAKALNLNKCMIWIPSIKEWRHTAFLDSDPEEGEIEEDGREKSIPKFALNLIIDEGYLKLRCVRDTKIFLGSIINQVDVPKIPAGQWEKNIETSSLTLGVCDIGSGRSPVSDSEGQFEEGTGFWSIQTRVDENGRLNTTHLILGIQDVGALCYLPKVAKEPVGGLIRDGKVGQVSYEVYLAARERIKEAVGDDGPDELSDELFREAENDPSLYGVVKVSNRFPTYYIFTHKCSIQRMYHNDCYKQVREKLKETDAAQLDHEKLTNLMNRIKSILYQHKSKGEYQIVWIAFEIESIEAMSAYAVNPDDVRQALQYLDIKHITDSLANGRDPTAVASRDIAQDNMDVDEVKDSSDAGSPGKPKK